MIEQQRITAAKLTKLGFNVTQTKTGSVATFGSPVALRLEITDNENDERARVQFFIVSRCVINIKPPPTMSTVRELINMLPRGKDK